ncbi:MAG: PH domain-containing protein [bacterium]
MNIERIVRLNDDESVLRVVRSLWLVRLPQLALAGLLVVAPFFFMLPLFSLRTYGLVAFALSELVGIVYTFRLYFEWDRNVFIVTTRRVIDVDQRGFFRHTVSEAPYDKLQDVSFSVPGFWGTVLRYGTVVVQTAGSQVNLELPAVRRPQEVHHLITETAAASRPDVTDGLHSQRVARLLDSAADLSNAEARAFLVALQDAVRHGDGSDGHRPSADALDEIMAEDDDDVSRAPARGKSRSR